MASRAFISRKPLAATPSGGLRLEPTKAAPAVQEVIRSPGRPLDGQTQAFMEPRFGHDFSGVRLHSDSTAAESALSVGARAYTVGQHIVFGPGQLDAESRSGRRLLAHELAHVVQQSSSDLGQIPVEHPVERIPDGSMRIAVAPMIGKEPDGLEREAESAAEQVNSQGHTAPLAGVAPGLSSLTTPLIQRVRVPLPSPIALCGKTLTHIDIEPPRPLPLEPCLPPTVLVTRINLVGRDLTVPSPGKGNQVFNLHVGVFRDPTTGRLCGIAYDSRRCLIPDCLPLGCFPTLQEVIDAILDFLWGILKFLGVVIVVAIIALLIELLGGILVPALALADSGTEGETGTNGPSEDSVAEMGGTTAVDV